MISEASNDSGTAYLRNDVLLRVWYLLLWLYLPSISIAQNQVIIDSISDPTTNAILVKYATKNGLEIESSVSKGLSILKAPEGIVIDSAEQTGIRINSSLVGLNISQGITGINIHKTSSDAINIDSAGTSGIHINHAADNGIKVNSAIKGIHIERAVSRGILVEKAPEGIVIDSAEQTGIRINSSLIGLNISQGIIGTNIHRTTGNAIQIDSAGMNGLDIAHAEDDGIYVKSANRYSLHILGRKALNNTDQGHIAVIKNESDSSAADVLALRVENSNPTSSSNFMTFYGGTNDIGAIEGDGGGGVTFKSGSADFAEYFLLENKNQRFQPGTVVGLRNGKISIRTDNAEQVLVITDRPILLGNFKKESDDWAKVSLIGQVPVLVDGKVKAGDWIVSSGNNDGLARSVRPEKIRIADQIIGRSLESKRSKTRGSVITTVGLDNSTAQKQIIQSLLLENQTLRDLLSQLDQRLKIIENRSSN